MKVTRTRVPAGSADPEQIAVSGTLDAFTADELRRVVNEVVSDRPSSVLLDLSALELIDSSGVGVIVSLYKRLREQGAPLSIVGLHGQPAAVLEMLGRLFRGQRSNAAAP